MTLVNRQWYQSSVWSLFHVGDVMQMIPVSINLTHSRVTHRSCRLTLFPLSLNYFLFWRTTGNGRYILGIKIVFRASLCQCCSVVSVACNGCIKFLFHRPWYLYMVLIFYQAKWYFVYINPLPNKPWFLHICMNSLLKTLWEKEKLLITSNFSISHSVFSPFGEHSVIFIKFEIVVCKLFQFGRVYNLPFGKGLKVITEW